ncbi:hypothetical protein FD754_012291, partial [Muntiacus muntjak]
SPCFVFLVGPCLIGINPSCLYHFCPLLSPSLHEMFLGISNFLEKICIYSGLLSKFENILLHLRRADNIRKYWSRYYQGSQGVIFVLDSASSEDDLETARNELHSALQHPQLCTLPFLILANHQDKPAARSVQEVFCCTCAAMLESEKIPVIRNMLVILFLNMKF